MKNRSQVEEGNQNQHFLFCLADQLGLLGGRASRVCFPTGWILLCFLNNLRVTRCGKQFLKSECNELLFKTGLHSAVYSHLWQVKASPQACNFFLPLKIHIALSCRFMWYFYIFFCITCIGNGCLVTCSFCIKEQSDFFIPLHMYDLGFGHFKVFKSVSCS